MTLKFRIMTLVCASVGMAGAMAAEHAHVHGVARIDVAIEARQISLHLDMPMANLLGFEHAPRSADERAQARAALEQLQHGAQWWRIDPAAHCVATRVQIDADALTQVGTAPAAGTHDDHADIDADYVFECADGAQAAAIEFDLFKAWPRLRRVEVQVAGPRGQFKRTLEPGRSRLELQR